MARARTRSSHTPGLLGLVLFPTYCSRVCVLTNTPLYLIPLCAASLEGLSIVTRGLAAQSVCVGELEMSGVGGK